MPLVPIALTGVYDLLPIHTRHLYPGELTVRVGEPIETKGMTVRQTEELNARLRAAIEGLLEPEERGCAESVEEERSTRRRLRGTLSLSGWAGISDYTEVFHACDDCDSRTDRQRAAYNARALPQYIEPLKAAGRTPWWCR